MLGCQYNLDSDGFCTLAGHLGQEARQTAVSPRRWEVKLSPGLRVSVGAYAAAQDATHTVSCNLFFYQWYSNTGEPGSVSEAKLPLPLSSSLVP